MTTNPNTLTGQARFDWLIDNKPEADWILETFDGDPIDPNIVGRGEDVRLHINAAVRKQGEDGAAWVLIRGNYGLKCMLDFETRDFLIANEFNIPVYSLKVVRRSQSGNALICTLDEVEYNGRRTTYSNVRTERVA